MRCRSVNAPGLLRLGQRQMGRSLSICNLPTSQRDVPTPPAHGLWHGGSVRGIRFAGDGVKAARPSEALDLLRVAGFNWNESSSSDIVYRACLRHQVYEWEHIRDFLKRFAR